MKAEIHPKYVESEIRCACGNVIKTRSTKPVVIVGICNECHPFYTGQQKFVDTAGRVDKFQQRLAKSEDDELQKLAVEEIADLKTTARRSGNRDAGGLFLSGHRRQNRQFGRCGTK